MIVLIYAHPYPDRSRANQRLLAAVRDLPGVEVRSLYDLYPDFAIDIEAEQEALLRADTVVWQGPVYWYSVPALLKHWFDTVLTHGWAHGKGTQALQGKRAWWVASAGGTAAAYGPGGHHMRAFADYVAPVEHTARYCGMHWLTPFVAHGGQRHTPEQLAAEQAELARLAAQHVQAIAGAVRA